MGTDVHLVAVGASADALDRAVATVHDLDARWSRFRPDSELSRLNRDDRDEVVVSPATAALVAAAVEAWHLTDGRFDPTVLPALVAQGYDRSFEDLDPTTVGAPVPVPGCADVHVDVDACTIARPAGVALDPGGLGKGLAADWVVEGLLRDGALGACANLGGDLRVSGLAPGADGWVVSVRHPSADEEVLRVAVDEGGVATSSTGRRRWGDGRSVRHHLIDPATGAPSATGVLGATVIAPTALTAEVLCKSLVLAPADEAVPLLREAGAGAVVTAEDGRPTFLEGLAA